MIFGKSETEIVRLALAGHSNMTDGCALWDADNGKMVSASYTTGTVENPENHLVEVFRISQGENPIVFINDDECDGCDRYCKGIFYDELRESQECIECCIGAYVENGFDDDFEDFKDGVEEQVRDLISEVVSDDLSKFNDIRIALSDRNGDAYDYVQVREKDYEMDVLDNLVDMAISSEFVLVESKDFLEGEIIYFSQLCDDRDKDVEFWAELQSRIEDFDLDGALELLQ